MADFQGIIVIHKEKGFTSHDVVAKLRGILHMKKIGHTGTLDPDATGVLPVALGKGTKLVLQIRKKRMRQCFIWESTRILRICPEQFWKSVR